VELEQSLTVPEVAKMLRMSRQTIYNMVKAGDIPHFRVGNKVRFNRADLDALMQTKTVTTGESK
jgi:putative molybdopterin biosynthesis protein|tara:strand:+ start:1823 stop:2014 length:192 start_codon:yes stop_codon:yes gene_type:complete